ncbi:acyl-CoA dehydratase activase [Vermiculatibacterium agrestimuris]|uniref:acyl-CoA dehydratase activase n=1 Tax=Vermiculatibacterium agrestimuris TaxID=2941519 RepID=UPI00203B10C5|nr:acyl-CoA dehydratase activase [Vermiculatibacterium agrestimuris]
MEHYVGIDIGSTTTKCVAVDGQGRVLSEVLVPSGAGTRADVKAVERLYEKLGCGREERRRMVATGYGRFLCEGADEQVSEITCHAKGLHSCLPQVRTIVDVGGQDLKVIRVDDGGRIEEFAMNDKCAAGTGRFLEVMCRIMNIDLSELEEYDARAKEACQISNTCTVFAESEVISKLSQGHAIEDMVAGIHDSVARKIYGLAKRVGVRPQVALTGGGGRNLGLVRAMERHFGQPVYLPQRPQLIGALGAALLAGGLV